LTNIFESIMEDCEQLYIGIFFLGIAKDGKT